MTGSLGPSQWTLGAAGGRSPWSVAMDVSVTASLPKDPCGSFIPSSTPSKGSLCSHGAVSCTGNLGFALLNPVEATVGVGWSC